MIATYSVQSPRIIPKEKRISTSLNVYVWQIIGETSLSYKGSMLFTYMGLKRPVNLPRVERSVSIINSESSKIKSRLIERIEHLNNQLSYEGWDGYDAIPINPDFVAVAKEAVISADPSDLRHWNIFPSRRGSLSFEFKGREIGAISFFRESLSYASRNNKGDILKGKLPLTVDNIIKIISKITNFLGY